MTFLSEEASLQMALDHVDCDALGSNQAGELVGNSTPCRSYSPGQQC